MDQQTIVGLGEVLVKRTKGYNPDEKYSDGFPMYTQHVVYLSVTMSKIPVVSLFLHCSR